MRIFTPEGQGYTIRFNLPLQGAEWKVGPFTPRGVAPG